MTVPPTGRRRSGPRSFLAGQFSLREQSSAILTAEDGS